MKIRKFCPPSTKACIFWLCNRMPERWKNAWHIHHSGTLKTTGCGVLVAPALSVVIDKGKGHTEGDDGQKASKRQ